MVAAEFSESRVEKFRPRIRSLVDGCISKIESGPRPIDLVTALGDPLPAAVISEYLGLPDEHREGVRWASSVVFNRYESRELVAQASLELRRRCMDTLRELEACPNESLISRMIRRYEANGAYDRRQMMLHLVSLITAGHETTSSMLVLSVLKLLEQPEHIRRRISDPLSATGLVDELLRYFSVGDVVTSRVLLDDIEIEGQVMRAGEGVIALGAAANHDPAVFHQPSEFDPDRRGAEHVAFGFGAHKCIGKALARVELEEALSQLFVRLPELRTSVAGRDARVSSGSLIHRVESCFVTW
ncbi:cytochrome P450 [Micrococcus luteus]|uniref:cytochrome P450 n=1 Tax=Micrococcus luteus TaxID=1270 RepID=UPI003633302F